jgi:hypothetical protein
LFFIIPRTVSWCCSGQAATQDLQPMQILGSISGCKVAGSTMPDSMAECRELVLSSSILEWRLKYQASIPNTGNKYKT